PESVKCALCEVLGAACDTASAPEMMELLDSSSEALRSAAMKGLIELGDLAKPWLTIAMAGGPSHSRIVAEYLLAILEGEEPPQIPEVINRVLLGTAEAHSSKEMEGYKHLEELLRRLLVVCGVSALAGVAVGAFVGPSALSFLYAISET